MAARDSIRDLAQPIVAAEGLELWDVEVSAGVVRVLVDRPQSGGDDALGHRSVGDDALRSQRVDLDALAEVSRGLSAALDENEAAAPSGRYQLEVSSPGVERTLRTPDQYRRYVDSEVSVKLTDPMGGARRFKGVLSSVGDDGIELTEESGRVVAIAYGQIERARTVLAWGPAPKPRTSGRSKRQSGKAGQSGQSGKSSNSAGHDKHQRDPQQGDSDQKPPATLSAARQGAPEEKDAS